MSYLNGPSFGTTMVSEVKPNNFFMPAPFDSRKKVTSPDAAAVVLVPLVFGADKEMCVVAFLDTKHSLLGTEVMSIGTIGQTFMTPREIFRAALLENASAVVLAHNHPSGNTEPSRDDEKVTKRIVRAGEMLGIEVLDHLIIAQESWVSLARRGVM